MLDVQVERVPVAQSAPPCPFMSGRGGAFSYGNRKRRVVQRREAVRIRHLRRSGSDIFVHHDVAGEGFETLTEGAEVRYDRDGASGVHVVNVTVA
jgi:hypothetical protein